jgi:scyllo-inositol 2-dehydrogenase (NADP+)
VKNGLDTQEDQLRSGMRPGNPEFAKNPPGLLREVDGDHDLRHEFATKDGAYVEFYRALAASIRDGKPFPVTPQDAVDVMTIIELAMQSDREGKRVAFARR